MNRTERKVLTETFDAVVQETQRLLNVNQEWRARYLGYAQRITQNIPTIREIRSGFREWAPLRLYLNTTSAKNAQRTVIFELRFLGQTVARLTGNNQGRRVLSTKGYVDTNLRDFDCKLEMHDEVWDGTEASKFRKFFRDRSAPRNLGENRGNEEHRLESLWLTELLKRQNGALPNAKAVVIAGARFPMPTPISASDHNQVTYSGRNGGGIDILARTGTGGVNTYLCVMEVKDENVPTEPPRDALKQAVAYATFIRELLRSDAGVLWWRIFKFSRTIPDSLVLYATCVMPSSGCNDYTFKNFEIPIGNDVIRLHYVYYTEHCNQITDVDTSLVW